MTENKHIGKIIYALVALALAAVMTVSAAAQGLFGLDKTVLGATIKEATGNTGVTQEYETKLFDTSDIITVDIIMDDDKWQELLDNAIREEYYECDVIINGERFCNVGIRAKGNTSLTNIAKDDTTDRYSFKLKFDEFVEGQTCYGLDKLVLNNNYADATNMKEAVIYDMFAYLDADASLYNYSKISVNGEYFGVYLALEGVEDSFLLRNYGTKAGELYKPENMDFGDGPSDKRMPDWKPDWEKNDDGSTVPSDDKADAGSRKERPEGMPEGFDPSKEMPEGFDPSKGMPEGGPGGGPGGPGSGGGSNLEYSDDDLDSYSTIWDGEISATSKSDHKRVVKALKAISEGDLSNIEEYMDVDNLLKYMAVHEFAVNNDSLSGSMAHNYYLYESDGQLNIIPWDYNLSWGGMGAAGRGDPQSGENLPAPRAPISEADSDGRASFSEGDSNGRPSDNSSGATSVINDPIDDSWQSTSFFDVLLENEEYNARYHEYLQMLVDYVENGRYEELTSRLHEQIDDLVKTDPTAFYTYDEYTAATEMLDKVIDLRAKSIKGQIDGTIPSTSEGQKEDASSLIDASDIDTSVMGTMNAGGDHKM